MTFMVLVVCQKVREKKQEWQERRQKLFVRDTIRRLVGADNIDNVLSSHVYDHVE